MPVFVPSHYVRLRLGLVLRDLPGPAFQRKVKGIMPIGKDIRTVGEQLLATDSTITPEDLAHALNEALNQFLPVRFRALPAHAIATDGTIGPEFLSVVVDTSRLTGDLGPEIPAEAMACVIDVYNTLDIGTFRASYERIAEAKALPKADPAPEGDFRPTNVTLGVIFARGSKVPLDSLAEALDQLNRTHSSRQWTDVLVVLPQGVVQYGMQFPGDDEMSGFLPPSHGVDIGIPAYIHIVVRSAGAYALNRLLAIVWPHVGTFSTGLNIGHHLSDILIDAPATGVTVCAYQFTVAGELRPVPEQEYVTSRFFPPATVTIQSPRGDVLGHIQFVPWQDGAYLRTIGMPIAPFLIMFGKKAFLMTIKRPNSELSYILPIRENDFKSMLAQFQQRSNMIVNPPKPPSWTMAKVADEGTASPFMARLYAGILGLRERTIPPGTSRDAFDKEYEAVLTALENARDANKKIITAVQGHRHKLATGAIVQRKNHTVTITEEIDHVLRKEIESFLNAGVRAIKDNQQRVLRRLGIETGYLYKKQGAFNTGILNLRTQHPELAEYFVQTRQRWSERFISIRNGLHTSWTLERVKHNATELAVTMTEPEVDGQPITTFVTNMLDRLLSFIEETTAYGLKAHLPEIVALREIPITERRSDFPERFRITLATSGAPLWRLVYHEGRFDEV